MDITPGDHPHRDIYKLMTGAIVPRPIAWVSTVDADGQPNLAPFSYFNAVCPQPPTVMFCSGVRGADSGRKDTHHNIVATGEFVINFVTDDLAEAMNITATEVPPDVDEFALAGLTAAPGVTVNVPHVAETPIYFECKLRDIITISDQPGGGHIILGTVTHMHFDDAVYRDGNYVDFAAYKPVGRMTGSGYIHSSDYFELHRPPSQIRPTE